MPAPIVPPLFIVTGLRYAFTIPSELRANWLFHMGCSTPAEYLVGARKAAFLLAMAPFGFLLPIFVTAWGWQAGSIHVLMGAITAWLLLDIQMAGLEKLPFTCSYVPGKANVKSMWMIYIMAYLVYVSGLSWVYLNVLRSPGHFLWFAVGAAVVKVAVARYRRSNAEFDIELVFDERPEPAVHTLGL